MKKNYEIRILNKIKDYWKNRSYWQKGAILGIIFGLLMYFGFFAFISVGSSVTMENMVAWLVFFVGFPLLVSVICGLLFGFTGFLIGLVKKGLWKKLVLTVLIIIAIIMTSYIVYHNFISEFKSNIPFEIEKKVLKKTDIEKEPILDYNVYAKENYIIVEHIDRLQDKDNIWVSVWYNKPNEIIITKWKKEIYMSDDIRDLTFYDVFLKATIGPLEKGTYTIKVVSSAWLGKMAKGLKPGWRTTTQKIKDVTIQ